MERAKKLDCREALRRLAAREPSAGSHPEVARLLRDGCGDDSEVLRVAQKLLLRPHLTVAVAGCFRPFLLLLIDGLLQSLRHLWLQRKCTLEGDSGQEGRTAGSLDCFEESASWSLSIHEYAVMAFSRLLELAPYALSCVLQYFSFAPEPFERLLRPGASLPADAPHLLDIIRACYRYLQLEPKSFRDLWDWSPFLDILQWKAIYDLLEQRPQVEVDVRWCAIQVLSLVLRMGDATTRALASTASHLTEEDCFSCLLRWEAYSREISVEKAGMYFEFNLVDEDEVMENVGKTDSSIPLIEDLQAVVNWRAGEGATFIEICGIQLPLRPSPDRTSYMGSRSSSFVLTSTVKQNLESVVLALSQRRPIMLDGPIGAGKSILIQELANLTGNSDVIFLHLDDQMDSKTLLGNYVCTEIPGEFKWQPGALTQAVIQGLWVVFEDIDRAPFEILSALVPLLVDRKLYIAGRGETIDAAENFYLFSTVTRTKFGSTHRGSGGKDVLANLWTTVVVDAPSDEELAVIIEARFPMLSALASKLIGTLNMARELASESTIESDGSGAISAHIGRQFSTRDLIKWCKRLTVLGSQHFEGQYLSNYVRERIYVEAVDCFAGSISCVADRQLVMRTIAEQWGIPLERVDFFSRMSKPSLQVSRASLQVGRANLSGFTHQDKIQSARVFANTGQGMRMLESIALCVEQKEPVLLVGETGTGKTTLVQYLARQMSMPLVVLNLSQQSDSVDLLGGYKPVDAQSVCVPLFETFSKIFRKTYSIADNAELFAQVGRLAEKKKWDKLLKAFRSIVGAVAKIAGSSFHPQVHEVGSMSNVTVSADASDKGEERTSKRRRRLSDNLLERWRLFSVELHKAERQVESAKASFAFSFVEGALVKALKEGRWILLDEVNLAPTETLERLTGVLEAEKGSLYLTERGDVESIKWHPNFRIFACMNPATDVGKRDLPISLKNRLTEFYVDELTNKEDLNVLVYQYLEAALPSPPVEDLVDFYLLARQEANVRLLDGANQKPQYSLRSLARALEYTKAAMPIYGFQRSLYDGICMSFLTLLDRPSSLIMEQLIFQAIFKQTGTGATKVLKSFLKVPPQPSSRHVLFEQFWVESGDAPPSRSALEMCQRYVLTSSIREHLKNLARAVFVRKHPVLLQGPTSSGKTSMIEYLALTTGHRFVRINNHEHTDLQEYLGSYVTDNSGKLVFQEGVLVQAVRNGYWIVLDELNLAPSDVLEALNRLLDDNRELFVPELQVMVRPHSHFMLFATQNPPGVYGGRKILSRAFRNRFIELHVDDIPDNEIQLILEKRCQIPGSYASKMVEVMKDLQRHRQGSKVFAGKHGFITPRDLFRWAERHGNGYEELAWHGYMLLAERLRDTDEMVVVQKTLEKHMRVKIQPDQLHETSSAEKVEQLKECLISTEYGSSFGRIVWTKSLKRLFNLVEHCVQHSEPILLVGDTGCGKTTVCQLLALLHQQKLHILNCHQHSETADFIGGLRPVRDRDSIAAKYLAATQKLLTSRLFGEVYDGELSPKIEDSTATMDIIQHVLSQIRSRYKSHTHDSTLQVVTSTREALEVADIEKIENDLLGLQRQYQSLFLWHDGPLVEAMRDGDFFLIDEISLADDSVLERLNSILEPKRLLVLAEKGGLVVEELVADPKFRILATMNPGGDFGKKELSPALRNRFTEIWVPPINDMDDLESIVIDRFAKPELLCLKDPLLHFWKWFQLHGEQGRLLSVRDLLSWVNFINITSNDIGCTSAFVHGALLVLLDGIGLGTGLSSIAAQQLRSRCVEHLLQQFPEGERQAFIPSSQLEGQIFVPEKMETKKLGYSSSLTDLFGIHPFYIPRGKQAVQTVTFELDAPTTSWNALRILRAMQLSKPVLLEGSPGVGKTSLVSALAFSSCHPLVRINLSEQTDIMDLFGSDMPVEGGKSGEFCWSDGVFLQALKAGHWVLLDELNLASQSVLEGLNACLDHRGEVFIPELGRVFKCPTTFRVFACQNPISQGGGRKGLPKSFLNRFTKVYVNALKEDDFLFIARALHPSISEALLQKMVHFNARLHEDTMVSHTYGHVGAPWEFNLRDILRSCELVEGMDGNWSEGKSLECFLDVVYLQRMRTKEDRHLVLGLYSKVFGAAAEIETHPVVSVNPETLQVGQATLQRRNGVQSQRDTLKQMQLLPGLGNSLESLMHCVKRGWMCNLVGPAASGKTSLVRVLAALTGNTLHEFSLSSATDTTDLLGCFEQHDPFRHWQDIVKRAHASLEAICIYCLSVSITTVPLERKFELVKSLLNSWAAFQKCPSSRCQSVLWMTTTKDQESLDPMAVEMLVQTVEQLEITRIVCGMPELEMDLHPIDLLEGLKTMKQSLGQVQNLGRFEWIDGGLLKALEHGEWVLLENANFCNPTVLDRLNPLLEPDGTILINERGLVNGEAMVVHPHPNFRLFLTVDPSHGEVSRAMRNRGIEIFLMKPDSFDLDLKQKHSREIPNDDISQDGYNLIVHAGIPSASLSKAMFQAHTDIKSLTKSLSGGKQISLREISHWVSLLQQLLERGAGLAWSLACSWVQTYVRRLDDVEARERALQIFKSRVAGLDFLDTKTWKGACLYVPGGWPMPHNLDLYCMRSEDACVKRDAMYLEALVSQFLSDKAADEWGTLVQVGADYEKRFSWLKSKRDTLPYFPASLLERYLNPHMRVQMCTSVKGEPHATLLNETKLRLAALWMVERGSMSDMRLRIRWLDKCAVSMNGVCQTFASLVLVLGMELRHPLARQLFAAWEQLEALRGGSFAAKHVPYSSRGLLSSFNGCSMRESHEGVKDTQIQVVFLGKKLLALRRCLLQWQLEDELYKSARTHRLGLLASPVMQSYLHQTNRASRNQTFSPHVPKTILKYLYALMTSIRDLENEVLIVTSVDLWKTSVGRAFNRLQEWHEAFWRVLLQRTFNLESFLFYWVQTKRLLVEITDLNADSSSGFEKIMGRLQDVVQVWDEAFYLGGRSGLKPLLWKHGGHPQLVNSKELWEQELELLNLCKSLWNTSDQEEEKHSVSTDIELRRVVVEGLSMSMWLRQKSLLKITEGNGKDSTSINVLDAQQESGEVLKMLLQKLDMEKLNQQGSAKEDIIPFAEGMRWPESKNFRLAECKCIDKHQNEQLALADMMYLPGVRALWVELSLWFDYLSIRLDTTLLAKISAATIFESADSSVSQALRQQGLDYKLVHSALEFSLTTSSRSPVDLVPHQHVLWFMDMMTSTTPDVSGGLQHINHEMWFRWHQANWRRSSKQPEELKGPPRLLQSGKEVPRSWALTEGPPRLFQAVQSVILSDKLGRRGPVRDYQAELVQLRVASMHMWNFQKQRFPNATTLDLSCLSVLFQQIILAHKKSFTVDKFLHIRQLLCALHEGVIMSEANCDEQQHKDKIFKELELLLQHSQHAGLLSILDTLVLPCAALLYCSTWKMSGVDGVLLQHGHVWLLIGSIRLRLLMPASGCDPVAKYSYLHAHVGERLANLTLDIEVRQNSELITRGAGNTSEILLLESRAGELKQQLSALSHKIIYRPQPPRFRDLCQDVQRFVAGSASSERMTTLWTKLKAEDQTFRSDSASIVQEAIAWQENSETFIQRLCRDFPAYRDFVQPVQHAVYELKFGLSLSLAAHLQFQTLDCDGIKHDHKALAALICLLMEFPSWPRRSVPSDNGFDGVGTISAADLVKNSTEQLVSWAASLQKSMIVPEEVLKMEMKVRILQVALLKVGQEMSETCLTTKADLKLLDLIFSSFSSLWIEIREYRVAQKREEAEMLKFSTSTYSMDVEETLNEEEFNTMFPNYKSDFDGFQEETVTSAEQDDRRAQKANEEPVKEDIILLEKAWDKMEEALFKDVRHIHQCIFSSSGLLQQEHQRFREVSEEERLHTFSLSYETGRHLLQAVGHCIPVSVDEQLLSAHLMKSSLEYHKLVGGSFTETFTTKPDIYVDAYPSEIALMLDPVGAFLKRIVDILKEWPEHPILQQLLQISKTLLSFSLDTVVMKALTGIELLLSKAQLWEENAAKHVSIAGELSSLSRLVTRWRKLELEGWSSLLEKAERKHAFSAQKLWFPLYGLLHRGVEEDVEKYFDSTISSIEEFMQTATFGEYRTRLSLVQAFYGHFSVRSRLKAPVNALARKGVEMLSSILYNVFKYYMQFLPVLDEMLVSEKSVIEKELKEFVKLSKWDDRSYYTLSLSAEKSHRKLQKFVKKYNDLLKRSVSELLSKQALRMGTKNLSLMDVTATKEEGYSPKSFSDGPQAENSQFKRKAAQMENSSKPMAQGLSANEWRRRCDTELVQLTVLAKEVSEVYPTGGFYQNQLPTLTSKIADLLGSFVFSEASSNNRSQGTDSLELLSTSVIVRAAELRNGEKKLAVKKKAMIDLLKVLRQIGLSHHKSAVPKGKRTPQSWLQIQPAEAGNLIHYSAKRFVPEFPREGQGYTDMHVVQIGVSLWNKASDYYFSNMALLQHLQRSALDFNKDLSLREVELTTRYTEHLLYLQQCQRSNGHGFGMKLLSLGQVIQVLSSCGQSSKALPRQGFMKKWLWHQKLFFDVLQQVVSETFLLFKSSEGIQSCPSNCMRVEAGALKSVLQNFLVGVKHYKMLLDCHLLPCGNGAGLEDGEVTWPFLYTPVMFEDLSASFTFLNGTQTTFRKLFEQQAICSMESTSGLQPLQQLLLKNHETSKEFESERLEFVHTQDKNVFELSSEFTELYENVISETLLAVQNVRKAQMGCGSFQPNFTGAEDAMEESLGPEGTLQSYDEVIMDQIVSLRVDRIFQAVLKLFMLVGKLLDNDHMEGSLAMIVGKLIACLQTPLEMLQAAGMRLLSDYISLHKSVTKFGYVLSNLFVSLCTDGFCVAKEEEAQGGSNKFDDASGTGMGEGEGVKDVSEQIEDEEQLMGGTEKGEDGPQNEAGKKANNGIEMEQDFSGDMMNLSDDEPKQDDENNEDDEQLESKMGEDDAENEVVDEKLWNNEDEKDQEPDAKEKYEKDSALSGSKPEDLEMRGKEEETLDEESGKGGRDEENGQSKEDSDKQPELPLELENEGEDDHQNNKDEALEDKSGVKPSAEETLELPENLDLDGGKSDKQGEEQQEEDAKTIAGGEQEGEENNPDLPEPTGVDEGMDEGPDEEGSRAPEQNPEASEADGGADEEETSLDMDVDRDPSSKLPDVEDEESAQSKKAGNRAIQEEPQEQQEDLLNPQDMDPRTSGKPSEHTSAVAGIAGSTSQLNDVEMEETGAAEAPREERPPTSMEWSSLETVDGENRMPFSSEPSSSSRDTQNIKRPDINPYRSLGDALKHWKERVKVVDVGEPPSEVESTEAVGEEPTTEQEDDGMEYEFVAKEEKGTAQALGSATKEQLDESNEVEDGLMEPEAVNDLMQPEEEVSEPHKATVPERMEETRVYAQSKKPRAGNMNPDSADQSDGLKDKELEKDIGLLGLEDTPEQLNATHDSIVLIQNQQKEETLSSETDFLPSIFEPWSEAEISRVRRELEIGLKESAGNIEAARVLWQKYEHLTARLSQELAEQLRLILEPTLATKLQGDYRTGKRINLKKIIPYIASSFRKDKIWLRRTKANKRQYQVVIAIDDSRSMSESHCGHMAVEALITICRAMSHVEIGQMAVASFGQKGNVHMLHDFDQPFSSEAGINVVSQFSFSQDNTIADRPMADLLQFLTRMLDMAASEAAGPLGNVSLQQLVLIIADGRLHEKESLRRCIQEARSRKQLLAFIVLDNPQDSVLDFESVSFVNGAWSSTKYLDSFPFPYYILLREIEALPRTLADLIRQWFELTQQSTSGQ